MYPSGRVPTHPFRVLGGVACGNTKGNFSHVGTKGILPDDMDTSGVYSGSLLGSFDQGAT
jgi:hypothetical protein